MRLTIDLRFSAPPVPASADLRVVTLAQLATSIRRPRALYELLRGERWDRVDVLEDAEWRSGVQAGGLGLAGLARTARFVHRRGADEDDLAPARFLGRGAVATLVAAPQELLATARLARRARRAAATDFALPAPTGRPRSVAYLRSEPTLRWMGLHVGGAATHTSGVVNGLVANGIDTRVFAAEQPAGTVGVSFTAVAPRRLLQLVAWLTLVDYSTAQVEAAAASRADVVYQRYALGSYAGLALARRLGVPLVLEFNGSEIWAHHHWGSGGQPLERDLAALERRNLTDATLIVVVSKVLRDQLVEQGIDARRVLVNPNGVDVDRLQRVREQEPAEWRRRLGRPEAPTVGFIGTFGLWHGVKLLPELIARVRDRHPDTRWHLVGDGPLRPEVLAELERRGLADRVLAPGLLEHGAATELLAACDAFVSPHVPNPDGTPFFGSPTKLFEYMGLGRAIVASDLDQIGEVLEHERSALLAEPGDAAAAAAGVCRLLEDPDLRARLAGAALADAYNEYSWTAHVERILDAVADLSALR